MKLSKDARAVIAGMVASSDDVNRSGIFAPQGVWAEIRAAFPLSEFQLWAEAHALSDDKGYDPDASSEEE